MRRTFFCCVPGVSGATGGLSTQQGELFPQFHDHVAQFEHGLVLLRDVSLQMCITFLQFRQSLAIAHPGSAQQDARGRQDNL